MEAGSDSYYQKILLKQTQHIGGYNYEQNYLYKEEKYFFNECDKEASLHYQQSRRIY